MTEIQKTRRKKGKERSSKNGRENKYIEKRAVRCYNEGDFMGNLLRNILFREGKAVLEKFIGYLISWKFAGSVIVVALTILIIVLLGKFKKIYIGRDSVDGKKETNARFIFSVARYVVYLLAFITILQINGVNVSALITGLGIVGIVVGFALQDVLKDFVMGNHIMLDHFFVVGDVVKYQNITGKIISFNIKVTRIMDIETGNLITVCNRNISEMTILADWNEIGIPAPYSEPAERMRKIMEEICRTAEREQKVKGCEFLGTNNFGESSIEYLIRVHCPPDQFKPIRRKILGITQDVYAREGISIPYNQLDVHMDK